MGIIAYKTFTIRSSGTPIKAQMWRDYPGRPGLWLWDGTNWYPFSVVVESDE